MARTKRNPDSAPTDSSPTADAESSDAPDVASEPAAPDAPAPAAATPPDPANPVTRDVSPRDPAADGIGDGVAAAAADAAKPLALTIELVWGDIRVLDVPVLVIGEYLDVPSHGATLAVDRALGWGLKRVLEMGLTNCRLGKVFFYPLKSTDGATLKARAILLVGMGDPDRFGRDDLTLLMANVTVALGLFGYDRFGMVLLGSSRGGMSLDRALRAMMEGVADGVAHLPPDGRPAALTVTLVEDTEARYDELRTNLERMQRPGGAGVDGIALKVVLPTPQWDPIDPDLNAEPDDDLPPQSETNRLTVTTLPDANREVGPTQVIYEFSALSETAAIPVRDQAVQSYFVQRMSPRLMIASTTRQQVMYGRLLANYILPEDFVRFLDSDMPVTLVVDAKTAEIPWEMAALKGHHGATFLGAHQLARQFRTLASAAPSIAPPRNNQLRVLIIADPSLHHPLSGARREGVIVAHALALAERVWGGSLDLSITLRIGPPPVLGQTPEILTEDDRRMLEVIKDDESRAALGALDEETRAALVSIPNFDQVFGSVGRTVPSVGPCDPLEILALVLTERYDVVHYAGHGVYDPAGPKGWFFDDGCILSASEIFRVRQVPRLVFANACYSAHTDSPPPPANALASPAQVNLAEAQVSLAEAFFSRGISNYIGAGWPVDDADATEFARRFYLQALGVDVASSGAMEPRDAAPPDTLGAALAIARQALIGRPTQPGKTWGAYQHYGDVNDKLLAFTNTDVGKANKDRDRTLPNNAGGKSDEATGDA